MCEVRWSWARWACLAPFQWTLSQGDSGWGPCFIPLVLVSLGFVESTVTKDTSDGCTILCDNQAMTGFSLRSIVSTDHKQQTCSFNIHKNYLCVHNWDLLQNVHLCVLNMDQAATWDPQRPTVKWFLNSVAMRFFKLVTAQAWCTFSKHFHMCTNAFVVTLIDSDW